VVSKGGSTVGDSLVPCYKDAIHHSCPSLIPRWLKGNCKENASEKRQIQNGGQMPCFFLFLVNSWA
jgi:hypothetical protein